MKPDFPCNVAAQNLRRGEDAEGWL